MAFSNIVGVLYMVDILYYTVIDATWEFGCGIVNFIV